MAKKPAFPPKKGAKGAPPFPPKKGAVPPPKKKKK